VVSVDLYESRKFETFILKSEAAERQYTILMSDFFRTYIDGEIKFNGDRECMSFIKETCEKHCRIVDGQL
jgi:hypothetical protein